MKEQEGGKYQVEQIGGQGQTSEPWRVCNSLDEARALVRKWLELDVDEPPRFEHNCKRCIFLGRFDRYGREDEPIELEKADLYFCPQAELLSGKWPTVIARYANAVNQYESGLSLAEIHPRLAEAKRRAQARGLLPFSESEDHEVYGVPGGVVYGRGMHIVTIRRAFQVG